MRPIYTTIHPLQTDRQQWRASKVAAWLLPPIISLGLVVPPSSAQEEPLEFSEVRMLIEINATDGDAGFQVKVDGHAWRRIRIDDPNGRKLYEVRAGGAVLEQGLTENFFESAEPSCEDVSLDQFLDRFPEGEYVVTGRTTDNDWLESVAMLTHELPDAPADLAPNAIGGVDPAAATISWAPGDGLENCPPVFAIVDPPENLFGYEVVVEREFPEPLIVFTAELPPGTTQVTIPAQFIDNNQIYKFEVLAIGETADGERGNQTISENFFCTAPIATIDCALPE